MLAARWAGFSWPTFEEMEGEDQAVVVAAYRIEQRLTALESQDAAARSRPKKNKPQRRGR